MKSFLALFAMAFVWSVSNATKLVESDPWCIDMPMTSKAKQLECLKSTMPARLVRRIFTQTIHGKRPSPRISPKKYLTEAEMLKLFRQPILVYEITYPDHAAYDVVFMFKDFPGHQFRAVIGFLENKEFYDLEAIVDSGPEESLKIRTDLQENKFSSFWF